MFSKSNFLDSLELETNICKHLHSKIDADNLDYKPTDGQRTMLELLQYLSGCLYVPTRCLIENDWSCAGECMKKSAEVTLDNFCDRMDEQLAAVKELVLPLTDSDFAGKETSFPTGAKAILGPALINFTLKFSAAYRMQLFLYIKATGRSELNTLNCWFGIDAPMPTMK